MKGRKKVWFVIIAAILSCVWCTGCLLVFAEEDENIFPTYEQDFSSVDAVNADFDAGYVSVQGSATRKETVGQENGHWFIEDGVLVRKNDIDGNNGGTWRAALLTYNKQQFTNFELEVDYLQGPSTYWWTAVIFRQTESKNFFDDGAGIFVQEQGMMTMWGSVGVGGPYEKSPVIENYDRNAWHHMKLTVQGNVARLQIDEEEPVEWSLQGSFYREGYVTLASINNDSAFDNFKITELPEAEEPEIPVIPPVAEADTDDALGNLATETDDTIKIERPLDFDNTYGAEQSEETGCKSSMVAGGGIAACIGLIGAAMVGLKKK